MSAEILTKETVTAYVAGHASDIGHFPADAALSAEAIQGGNVNFAFCVKSSCGKSVFVKQAPEYVAVFGPDGLPLTSTRSKCPQLCVSAFHALTRIIETIQGSGRGRACQLAVQRVRDRDDEGIRIGIRRNHLRLLEKPGSLQLVQGNSHGI